MTLRDDYVMKLEQENDDLRARVRALESQLGFTFSSPPQLALSKQESVIFGCLMKNQLVRKEMAMDALYFHKQDEAEIKIVDVYVCKLRKKLKPWGIEIQTQWGQGYFLPPESKGAARKLLDGFKQAEAAVA